MSLVLGPVHHWMYKKIKTTEAREASVADALKAKYGQEGEELLSSVYEKHPISSPDTPLEELLGDMPIHQGIQELIVKAETREAATIAAFCEKYGDEVKDLIIKAAHDNGVEFGKKAPGEKGVTGDCDAEKAFELIQSYLCDGMPCDRGAQVQEEAPNRTTWDHTECVHEQYWKAAGASFETMCDMVNSWISGFGEGANSKIKHTREKAIAVGDSDCLNVFELT
ncbi:MAG: hypothetical protein ACUZ8I_06015 [Candidatus Scalindua sp.]